MTQTIEQLTARVRELEEENARLRFALADTEALELGTSERLAASQLHAEQLREALEFLSARIVTMDLGGVVERALAIPLDTSAFDAYVANQREAAYREVCRAADQFEADLTRQRDLAVEAFERLEHSFDFGEIAGIEPEACGRSKKFITNTISTIKESEKP